MAPGPHRPLDLPLITFTVGQGQSGPLTCQLQVTVPSGQARCPLILLSAGFLLNSQLYRSYASELASHGYAVARYDLPELVDDLVVVSTMGSVLSTCTSDARVSGYVDAGAILLMGHSRGGKVSCLLAGQDPRVKGLLLLDPVDNTQMTPQGAGYPSSLPALRTASAAPRRIPTLIIGAAMNSNVIPVEGNYKRFFAATGSGLAWLLDLSGAGHMQFVDEQISLLSMLSPPGPMPDEAVRKVSRAAALAWADQVAVPLARGNSIDGEAVQRALMSELATFRMAAGSSIDSQLKGLAVFSASATSGGSSSSSSSSSNGNTSSSSSSGSSATMGQQRYDAYCNTATNPVGGDTYTMPPRAPPAGASGSGSAAGGSSDGASSRFPRVTESYEQLMTKRAKELKGMLTERGIDCADCYEKEELARRIVQRCA